MKIDYTKYGLTPARLVPPYGPPAPKIMIIGDYPDINDMRVGRPFIGGPGRQLDNCLKMSGIPRTDCYLTNVIKDMDKPLNYYISIPAKATTEVKISPSGQSYLDLLADEIREINPNIIIGLGNVALFALTSRRGITNWRGSILESTLVEGKKVICTFHPSTIVPPKCVFLNKHLITLDLKNAAKQSLYSQILPQSYSIKIKPTFHESMEALEQCISSGHLGIPIDADIEVVNRQLSCISFAWTPSDCISIPFYYGAGDYFTLPQEMEIMRKITELYEDPRVPIRGQNHIFDTAFLMNRYGIKPRGPIHDTMIAQKTILPDYKAGLDFITSTYTELPYYKADGKQWMKVGGAFETFWMYNGLDSIATAKAAAKQMKDLELQGNLEVYQRACDLIKPLLYMMQRGLRVDLDGMKEEIINTDAKVLTTNNELQELVKAKTNDPNFSLNHNSPKQLIEYFYTRLKNKAYTKGGKKTTDVDAMKRLARKGIKEARLILDLRSLTKRKSVYLDVDKVDPDGRYRSQYNPVGAKTGRLSSSETIFGTGGNQQNWPHDMLKFLTADPGYLLYSMDLSQAENRIVAYVGKIPQMIECFETGTDVHSLTAGLIFGKPIHEVSREPGSVTLGDGRASERDWGKKANHGFNYGWSYKAFALRYEIPEKEAKFIHNKYHAVYPGVQQNYHKMIQDQLYKNRVITNLMGRKRLVLGDIEGRGATQVFRELYSQIPQSSTADKINKHGINFIYYNQQWFRPLEMLTQIHDSIIFQIPLSIPFIQHAEMIRRIKDSLEIPFTYHERDFVVPADVSIGFSMSHDEQLEIKSGEIAETNLNFADQIEAVYEELRGN